MSYPIRRSHKQVQPARTLARSVSWPRLVWSMAALWFAMLIASVLAG